MATRSMTKTALVQAIAENAGIERKQAAQVLMALGEIIRREVAAGGAVSLPGLAKVACRDRPQRLVRNPATGETLTCEADRTVKSTIVKPLKEAIA